MIDAVIAAMPQFAGIKDAAPDATFRIRGQKLAREPHRYSGRTAMRANISVHEPRQPQDKDTMFAFSMEGNNQPTARDLKFRSHGRRAGTPAGVEQIRDEVGGKLRHGDPGVRLIEATEGGLDYFTTVPASFGRRTVSGVLRRITTCLAATNCLSVLRSSRAVCRSRISNLTRRMPEIERQCRDARLL